MNQIPAGGILNKVFNSQRILSTERMKWVDILKGIAIILVVYRHVLIGLQRKLIDVPEILVTANYIFYSFRMPLFFLLSGLFLIRSLKKKKISTLAEEKFATLLYPYLIWASIQVAVQILLANSSVTNSKRGPGDFLYILYQPKELDQFWYLPALFNSIICYLFLHGVLKVRSIFHCLFALTIYFIAPLFREISIIADWMAFYLFLYLGTLISEFFFSETNNRRLKKPALFLITIPVFILSQYLYLLKGEYYYSDTFPGKAVFIFISLTGAFMMLLLAYQIEDLKISNVLRVIGFHSLYIYIMHVLVAGFIRTMLVSVLHIYEPYVLLFSGIFFSIIICIVVYNLLIRNGPFWFLFTYRKNIQ